MFAERLSRHSELILCKEQNPYTLQVGVTLAAIPLYSQLVTFLAFKFQAKKNDPIKVVTSSNIWNRVGSYARNYQKVENDDEQ